MKGESVCREGSSHSTVDPVVAGSGSESHLLDFGASLSSVEISSIGRVGVGFSNGVEGII